MTKVFNGTFTITNPRTGGYRTYRVRTRNWACPSCWAKPRPAWVKSTDPDSECSQCQGKGQPNRVLEVLVGPDNTSSYKGIAFIDESGVRVWRKLRDTEFEKLAQVYWSAIAGALDLPIQESRTCVRCNRKLTTPESIAAGIGPDCAGR